MASNVAETIIGAAVLAVAGGFLVYAANTADVALGGGGYTLTAEFRKAEGLDVGGDVQIGGVKVGTVTSIELNPENYFAIVEVSMREGVKIPEDSVAKITSESLLGGNYIAIDPGSSDFMLADKDPFQYVQGSVNLMDLIGKAVQGVGID